MKLRTILWMMRQGSQIITVLFVKVIVVMGIVIVDVSNIIVYKS